MTGVTSSHRRGFRAGWALAAADAAEAVTRADVAAEADSAARVLQARYRLEADALPDLRAGFADGYSARRAS